MGHLLGEAMHIILLTDRHGATRSFNLNLRWLLSIIGFLLISALLGGSIMGAVWSAKPAMDSDLMLALEDQREQVDAVHQEARRQLDAFAAHVAELQARLTRLDALGERLTELADLDAGEFSFSQTVGLGGPEDPLDGDSYAAPSFMNALNTLAERLNDREQQLEILEHLLSERRMNDATSLAGRPVKQSYISSPFGKRVHPLTGRITMHHGIDFAAMAGSDVISVAAGVVTFSGKKPGYGNTVEVSHKDGYVTLYAHNQKNLVKVGDLVSRGQIIAKVGRSGRATGYHVHFEVVHNGRKVNPATYIARASQTE